MARLRVVKLTISNPCMHKKLDEFDQIQDSFMLAQVAKEGKANQKKEKRDHQADNCLTDDTGENVTRRDDTIAKKRQIQQIGKVEIGRIIVFDNMDYQQVLHNMSEKHQNRFYYWVTYMSTENRVSACSLSNENPIQKLDAVPNALFLPSKEDHSKQKNYYIFMVARLCTECIECLKPLANVIKKHKPYKHSTETAKATNTVSVFYDRVFDKL